MSEHTERRQYSRADLAEFKGLDGAGVSAVLGAFDARGRGWVHVNPIPLNPTPGSIWTASEPHVQNEFVRRLNAAGIPTTLRDTRGKEIDGACGQLVATEDDEAAASVS